MLKIPRVMAAMVAALTALLVAGAALAQPANPGHYFYGYAGDVTLDGNSLPGGTTINALADGEVVASGVVNTDGSWSITVPADAGEVAFSVGDAVSSTSFPVEAARTTPVKLALITPEPEPEVTEPEEGAEDDGSDMGDELGTEDDGTMMGGDGDGTEGDELGTEDDGTMMGGDGDGTEGDELGTEDDGTMMGGDGDGSEGAEDDGDAMPDDGTDGDGMPAELLDEDPPTDEAMGTDGDGDPAMGTDEDAGDDGTAMGTDEDADGDDGQMESDTGDTDTVGGVNDFGTTGTGGLADSRSSAALWGGIGSALALLALLGGGFAVRRRAQSRS